MGDDQTKSRASPKARRGSVAVAQQKTQQVVQVLKHDESMDEAEKQWYQKPSWACVAFVVLNLVLCGYAYVDVNTIKKSNDTTVEEDTFSEENGVYVNLVVGVILVFTQYCLVAMCFLSFVGFLFGRKRWWAGPYCTGFIGFGDGSASEVPPERLLTSWGISTVSEDLYFDAKKWTKQEPPVRLARELVLMGYRGRSDDPIVRPGSASWSKKPSASGPHTHTHTHTHTYTRLGRRLAALGSLALPGRGRATVSGARAGKPPPKPPISPHRL